jgi:uncharacterized membrane protein
MTQANDAATARPAQCRREAGLDALRGLAMIWMAAFHGAFDLNHAGLIARQNFYSDPFWTVQRTVILSLFLFCAGWALALRRDRGFDAAFTRRWLQVAGCAVAVSLGSWWMFPRSFIWFGVLHAMALMLPLTMLLTGWLGQRAMLWGGIGLVLVAAPAFLGGFVWFDSRWTGWIGLMTHKPITEDYVPLLPWLGVLWIGLAFGFALGLFKRQRDSVWQLPRWLVPLAHLGRWPLSFYMLHQPVLIGLIEGMVWLKMGGR